MNQKSIFANQKKHRRESKKAYSRIKKSIAAKQKDLAYFVNQKSIPVNQKKHSRESKKAYSGTFSRRRFSWMKRLTSTSYLYHYYHYHYYHYHYILSTAINPSFCILYYIYNGLRSK